MLVVDQHVDGSAAQASPGQSRRHYAPDVPCVRVGPGFTPTRGDAVVAFDPAMPGMPGMPGAMPGANVLPSPERAARELYALLRRLESEGAARIVVVMPPDTPEWAAVRDRLIRATVPWVQ